jgi:C-terminal processing protease CtpA/Prc
MMLVDELSVSCGDIVPAIMKANGIMPLFGHTTMGGGGNVEEVATLTNTRWTLNLSRGLGTVFDPTGAYPEAGFIEDNGVTPDVAYDHSLADFRAGYVGYVSAFNAALAHQLATPTP